MKKRISKSNLQVKRDMYAALLQLMGEKPFSAISVSDITAGAGVSRMAFYRNYDTLEDILIEHISRIMELYQAEETEQTIFYDKKYALHCFRFLYSQREFIDALIAAGMGDLFLAKITEYLIRKWINPGSGTGKDILSLSAYAGSIYNMYRMWSKTGFVELSEEVAEILCNSRK